MFGPHRKQLAASDQERLQGHLEAVVEHAPEPGVVTRLGRRKALHEAGITLDDGQNQAAVTLRW